MSNNNNSYLEENENIQLSEVINTIDSEPRRENFLMCPECQIRSPHLKNIFYDVNENEIKAEYKCVCFQNKKKFYKGNFIKFNDNWNSTFKSLSKASF